MQALAYRSIWISDVHLGTRDAKTGLLLDFLRHTESKYLYLVGDIIDCWKLRSGRHWPQINNDLVRLVMKKARNGTQVVYIPGNHAAIAEYDGIVCGNTGDWVESCTALAEESDGRLRLIHWADESAILLDERQADADCDSDGRMVPAG